MKFYTVLKEIREAKKISREKVAAAADVSTNTIYNIEKGKCVPNVLLALKISDILQIDVNELFKEVK